MEEVKKSILGSSFLIRIDDTLTDFDRKVLSHLYLPIIGDRALNIYNTLYTLFEPGLRETEIITHLRLLKMLNLDESMFIEERIKLEAIGLLSTYVKDNIYLYVLKDVLTPYEFFNNDGLVRVLTSIIGISETDNLMMELLAGKFDYESFTDITTTFDECFSLVDKENASINNIGVDTRNFGIRVSEKTFNIDHFMILVSASNMIDESVLKDRNFIDLVIRYAYLFGLSVEEMKEACIMAASLEKTVNEKELIFHVKRLYDAKGKQTSFVPRGQKVSSNNEVVRTLESITPNQLVKNKYGTSLTSSEIEMFNDILLTTKVSVGILNVAIIYVLESKNGEIPAANYFIKVINTWLRSGVKNVQDALDFINGDVKTKRTPKKSDSRKVKPTPSWYNEEKSEEEINEDEENNELFDIEKFFNPNK